VAWGQVRDDSSVSDTGLGQSCKHGSALGMNISQRTWAKNKKEPATSEQQA